MEQEREQISLLDLYKAIKRTKKKFLTILFLFIFSSGSYAILKKPVWEGEFQIVLFSEEQRLDKINIDSKLSNLIDNEKKNSLQTQVEVLKSSYLLMPIFNLVKNYKIDNGENFEKVSFKDWVRNYINIALQKNTSVLYISYRDKDKDLIKQVLDNLSNSYQKYSGEKRRRKLDLTKNYLKEQVSFYKNESLQSIKRAQQYAIKYDLTPLQQKEVGDDEIINDLDIDIKRVKAANNIRNIDENLTQINKLKEDNDEETLFYFSMNLIKEERPDLLFQYDELEKKIIKNKAIFTDKNREIIFLRKEKISLEKLIKTKAIGFLNSQRNINQATLKASERPKGVLLQYSDFVIQAKKDFTTLQNLEDAQRINLLEIARTEDPWKLITKPRILQKPVYPRRIRILFFGTLLGLLGATIYSYFKDPKKDFIFKRKDANKFLKFNSETKIINIDYEDLEEKILLLLENLQIDKSIIRLNMFLIGNINDSSKSKIIEIFDKSNTKIKLQFTNKISMVDEGEKIILLAELGNFKNANITSFSEKLNLKKFNMSYILIIGSNID